MAYYVNIPPRVEKRIRKFPQKDLIRIRTTVAALSLDPFAGKKLEGRYKEFYSIRVWPYRIIYTIKKKELVIEVIEIEHRGGAYRK